MLDTKLKTQEVQRIPSRINARKKRNKNKDYAKAYHFKLKKMKDKEKKPERSQRKICLMYRGAKLRITSHFSEII